MYIYIYISLYYIYIMYIYQYVYISIPISQYIPLSLPPLVSICLLPMSIYVYLRFLPNLDMRDYIDNSVGDTGHTNRRQIMVQK